ncbi:hypothetical protein Cni_G02225 [Canna indica]|uniref:Uncharacterized protein n=1 Tax=Canna indica TaxID=4628 RepID=A0AAQ3JQL0_9LILI|nr:hypothetical protein Cni_G02225 [Canna indica]
MAPRSCSSPITMMCRALTPLRASASSTPSRTIPSWRMSVLRTTSAALSTRQPLELLHPTVSLCTANARCLTTLMISWFSVRDARTVKALKSHFLGKEKRPDRQLSFQTRSSLFHPSCMGMTIEQAKKLDHFLCSDCDSEHDAKRSMNGFPASPVSETKAEPKRRRR